MHNITVWPSGKTIQIAESEDLRDCLLKNGFHVKTTCGGCASCGQCVVVIKEGAENLSEINFEEKQLLGNVFHITGERISCQTYVKGDIAVDISMHESNQKSKAKTIRKTKEDQIKEAQEKASQEKKIREGGRKKPRAFNYENQNEKDKETK